MTSNIKLKQECKATLNSIRDLLPQEDRQKIEPLLRQILDLTKGLVENAKVSPEEHEALASQVGTLTKERTRLSETIAALRRDLEKASTLKDALASLESEKNHLDNLLTDVIFDSLHRCAANGIGLIAKCGDSGVTQWIAEKTASIELDAIERRALLAVCQVAASACLSEEAVAELVKVFSFISTPNGASHWESAFSSCFKAAGQSGPSEDSEEDEWWWLAVNGASCAACFVQARAADLEVAPVPEQLIGFRTREEQLEIQQFLLTAPIEDVDRYLASLPPKIKAGEMGYVRPRNPEPPTHGPTNWHLKRR